MKSTSPLRKKLAIKTKELAKLKVIKKRKNHPNKKSLSRLSSNVDSAEEEPRPITQPIITFEEYKRNRNLEY